MIIKKKMQVELQIENLVR